MTVRLRKILLLSFSAIATLSLAPAAHTLVPKGVAPLLDSAAQAKDGGHDSDGGGRGSDGGDHDSDGGDHDSDGGKGDHDSNAGGNGKGRGHDDSASDDDGDTETEHGVESEDHHDNGRRRHGNDVARAHANENSRVAISASDDAIEGLKDGSLKAVDSLGRELEVEIEVEHGTTRVEVKLHDDVDDSQPITGVSIVPAT